MRHHLPVPLAGQIAAIGALAFVLAPSTSSADAAGTSTVRVSVASFRNQDGYFGCQLIDDSSAFPEGRQGRGVRKAVSGTRGTCVFKDVAPGTYAVAVMHDENGNRKLDKSLFGVPTEGYGVSNNKTYAMRAPRWTESKFSVAAGESKSLNVRLRY